MFAIVPEGCPLWAKSGHWPLVLGCRLCAKSRTLKSWARLNLTINHVATSFSCLLPRLVFALTKAEWSTAVWSA